MERLNLYSFRGYNFHNKDLRLNENSMKELLICELVTYFGARKVMDDYFSL